MVNLMKFSVWFSRVNIMQLFEKMAQSLWTTNTTSSSAGCQFSPEGGAVMSQWCNSLLNWGINHWDVTDIWLYCRPPSFLHHFFSPKSAVLLLSATPAGTLRLFPTRCPPPAVFPSLLLHPVFLHFLCLIHIINPSFYIFYPFIYLLHWPFAPLPMPVSVWVLCQPLCQDRSPATPASGGTERETGRAHCHCWTGVVLQLGYTLSNHMTNTLPLMADLEHRAAFLHLDWTVWEVKHRTPSYQPTNSHSSSVLVTLDGFNTCKPDFKWLVCADFPD